MIHKKKLWLVAVVVLSAASACSEIEGARPPDRNAVEQVSAPSSAVLQSLYYSASANGSAGSTTTTSLDGDTVWFHGSWTVPVTLTPGQPATIVATVRDNPPTCSTCLDGDYVQVRLISTVSGVVAMTQSYGLVGARGDQPLTLSTGSHVPTANESWLLSYSTVFSPNTPGAVLDKAAPFQVVQGGRRVITRRFSPNWITPGPFVPSVNPAPGTNPTVWKSVGAVPANAEFTIPFESGDTITGLGWDAYGDGGAGIGSVDILYQHPVNGVLSQPSGVFDTHRQPGWSRYNATPFTPQTLTDDGYLWVRLEVDATNYYMGMVTATFLH